MTEEWEQIFLYERANIMNLGDIRFQWNMGLMDDNPYNSQVRKAANSEEFWKWLGALRRQRGYSVISYTSTNTSPVPSSAELTCAV